LKCQKHKTSQGRGGGAYEKRKGQRKKLRPYRSGPKTKKKRIRKSVVWEGGNWPCNNFWGTGKGHKNSGWRRR